MFFPKTSCGLIHDMVFSVMLKVLSRENLNSNL